MKKQTLFVVSIFSMLSLAAQDVVATSGESYSTSSGTIDFTVGEVMIHTGTDGNNYLTSGFNQSNWNFVGVEDFAPKYEVKIFPNPLEKELNIKTNSFENITYTLYDGQGKVLLRDKLMGEQTSIPVGHLIPGSYSLNLNNESENLKTFKLIKTH